MCVWMNHRIRNRMLDDCIKQSLNAPPTTPQYKERRTPFDIHDCGDEIITRLAKEEQEKMDQENASGGKGNGTSGCGWMY